MKKFNKKQLEILKDYFYIWEDGQIIQLESWTDGGVDMIIYIDKRENADYLTQLKNFINNFDIDEEIEIHRENEAYKRDFKITESIEDFESYIEEIKETVKKIEEAGR